MNRGVPLIRIVISTDASRAWGMVEQASSPPRLAADVEYALRNKDVDGRDEPGHDALVEPRSAWQALLHCFRIVLSMRAGLDCNLAAQLRRAAVL
jgi:hypothetical protein